MSYNQNYRRSSGNPNHFGQPASNDGGRTQNYHDCNFFMTPPPVPPSLVPPLYKDNRRDWRRSDQREYHNIQGYQNNRHDQNNRKRRHDISAQNTSYSSERTSFGVKRDYVDGSRRQSYQNFQKPNFDQSKPAEFDIPFDSKDECSDDELRYYLGISKEEVPVYVLRMRKMGADGYPPAFLDACVKVSNTLPFFGDEEIYTKRIIKTSDLMPIRGFTHIAGDDISQKFVDFMQKVADSDYERSHSDIVNKAKLAGLNLQKEYCTIEVEEEKKFKGTLRFDIPDYELSTDEGYALGENTKGMKHNLEGFRDGIQPFVASEPNTPSNFMSTLRNLMKKPGSDASNNDDYPRPLDDML